MNASNVLTGPLLLVQLCVTTVLSFFARFLDTTFSWTVRACEGPGSNPDVNKASPNAVTPTSVNYHFTRKCNYKCGFCFHTAKTSFVLPLDEAKGGLKLLKDSGK